MQKLEDKKAKRDWKSSKKRFGDAFDKSQLCVHRKIQKNKNHSCKEWQKSLENNGFNRCKALIEELEIADPDTGPELDG